MGVRVESLQRRGRHRYAEHRDQCFRRNHSREVRRAPGCGNDAVKPATLRLFRKFEHQVWRPMRRHNARLIWNAKLGEQIARGSEV
jgi:hypothetical protein